MPETERKIMEACGKLLKQLPAPEKERFLSFTEGMVFMNTRMTHDSEPEQVRR